jgi:SAM-dependent methyltransferase
VPWRWEEQATNWVRWARTPGHDVGWHYFSAFVSLLPPPRGLTLELGCGEGRVVRELTARGYPTIGLELSSTLLEAAHDADNEGRYVQGDAATLPFADSTFDLVVTYNSLMDIELMPGAVSQVARVLRTGGRMCISVTHPVADAGRFVSHEPDAGFVIDGSYLGKRDFEELAQRGGLEMTFSGWAYPLEAYFAAFEDAGLLVESLREPAAAEDDVRRDEGERRWRRIPNFLHLCVVKPEVEHRT